jgi:hypothetical protein
MWRHGDRSYGGSKSQRRRGAEGRSRRDAEARRIEVAEAWRVQVTVTTRMCGGSKTRQVKSGGHLEVRSVWKLIER